MHDATSRILLLGVDYPTLGEYALALQADERTACALSVGADAATMARAFKGDAAVPNEDAVLAIDTGERTLLAVADAHYGHAASHVLLQELDARGSTLPRNVLELFDLVCAIGGTESDATDVSESTLLVAVLDRGRGVTFGVSFGDSSVVVAGRAPAVPRNVRHPVYVTPRVAESLHPTRGVEFEFAVTPGELVVAFTDGVDECCYRTPEASLQPSDIMAVAVSAKMQPEAFVAGLTELALVGVRGNPGGQDNIAIAATRV